MSEMEENQVRYWTAMIFSANQLRVSRNPMKEGQVLSKGSGFIAWSLSPIAREILISDTLPPEVERICSEMKYCFRNRGEQ